MATVPEKEYLLTTCCSVCGQPAAPHLHYGAISCYSCRAFFRRGRPKQLRCFFGHGRCEISRHNRTSCKLCRYRKCLEVGMKPNKVDFYLKKRKQKEVQDANNENSPSCYEKDFARESPKADRVHAPFMCVGRAMQTNQLINEALNNNTETSKEAKLGSEEDVYDPMDKCDSNEYTPHFLPIQNDITGKLSQFNKPFNSIYWDPKLAYTYRNDVTNLEDPKIGCERFDESYKGLNQASNFGELNRSKENVNNPYDVSDSSNQTSVIRYLNSRGTIYPVEKRQENWQEKYNNQQNQTKYEIFHPIEPYYSPKENETFERETYDSSSTNNNIKRSTAAFKDGQFQEVEKRKPDLDHSFYTKFVDDYFEEMQSRDIEATNTGNLLDISSIPNRISKRKCSDSEEEDNPVFSKEVQTTPLKKRQRMLEIPYATGHAVNKQVLPILTFTFEEEFQVVNYIVRIQQYQNRRFEYVCTQFQHYKEMAAAFVACTSIGRKIPFNRQIEKQLFSIGLEFTKQSCQNIYEEMRVLSSEVRREVLNITYPALYVVMWAILEGNTQEHTWIEQHRKTLHITKENHAALKDYIRGLENVRSISFKDQERFTSPWAVEMEDEEKFKRTVTMVGRLLRGDQHLQALYHMFVMMDCGKKAPEKIQNDPALCNIQVKLGQLMYRYISTKSDLSDKLTGDIPEETKEKINTFPEDTDPDEKTRLLISLVDDIHDCVDIMQTRSLLV